MSGPKGLQSRQERGREECETSIKLEQQSVHVAKSIDDIDRLHAGPLNAESSDIAIIRFCNLLRPFVRFLTTEQKAFLDTGT